MVKLRKVERNDDMTCSHGESVVFILHVKEMFFNRRGTVTMRAEALHGHEWEYRSFANKKGGIGITLLFI